MSCTDRPDRNHGGKLIITFYGWTHTSFRCLHQVSYPDHILDRDHAGTRRRVPGAVSCHYQPCDLCMGGVAGYHVLTTELFGIGLL